MELADATRTMDKGNSHNENIVASGEWPAKSAPVHISERSELRAFLRVRRKGIAPEAVGLPVKPQRRARGLTRDEVAELAGVSTGWYAQFELGHPINISSKRLQAIAGALRLDAYETLYLFRLVGIPAPENIKSRPDSIPCEMRAIVDGISSFPAQILSRRFDVLYMNRAGEAILNDPPFNDADQYNVVWRLFMDPNRRATNDRWEDFARSVTAALRLSYSTSLGDPWFEKLISRLSAASADFARFWNEYRVAPAIRNRVAIKLSSGIANIVWSVLPVPFAGLFLAFSVPDDEQSAALLRQHAERYVDMP